MADWMTQLSYHYQRQRQTYSKDRLMLVFDIDGTILDMRYMMVNLLQAYDRHNGTRFFCDLAIDQIDAHETQINLLLDQLRIDFSDQCHILSWYYQQCRNPEFMREYSRAFPGVLEIIAWFKSQTNTVVALNSDRSEALRFTTLNILNKLAQTHRTVFESPLLYMNASGKATDIMASKLAGLRHFQAQGYRIIALVDNEPDIICAVANQGDFDDVLLLHADTLYTSKIELKPHAAYSGSGYQMKNLLQAVCCG